MLKKSYWHIAIAAVCIAIFFTKFWPLAAVLLIATASHWIQSNYKNLI